ncbi:MAG: hypothetical protein AAFQ68_06500 [Bacteroidota bacterium]
MLELPFDYWNKLASQLILISSLLGGFSLAVLISLLNAQETGRILNAMIRTAIIAASSFIICIFSLNKIILMTTEGYPLEVSQGEIQSPQMIGGIALLLGLVCLLLLIALSGWRKSRSMGIFTTVVGIIAFILLMIVI